MSFLALLVLGATALYFLTPAERARVVGRLQTAAGRTVIVARTVHENPARDLLIRRTPWLLVTPALAAAWIVIALGVAFSDGADGLVAWGASIGPRTTAGEWWRLLTATFVHAGTLRLVMSVVALVPLGLVLERAIGHQAFAAAYLVAGGFASLAALSTDPLAVTNGPSGALFGLYGLLIAVLLWSRLHAGTFTIPWTALKEIGVSAAVFIPYSLIAAGGLRADLLTGAITGFAFGTLAARDISAHKPPPRRLAAIAGAALMVAAAWAVPLRGTTDLRPEIARLVATEDRTARLYQNAVQQFRLGAKSAASLADLIERSILPDLRAAEGRLKAATGVPSQQQPLLSDATEYLRLRHESWRLRAEALRDSRMGPLREAETIEDSALQIVARLKAEVPESVTTPESQIPTPKASADLR